MDLWVAPLATAIYATATYRQPFWTQLHILIMGALDDTQYELDHPLSDGDARTFCFLILATLFTLRALYNYRLPSASPKPVPQLSHAQSAKRSKSKF